MNKKRKREETKQHGYYTQVPFTLENGLAKPGSSANALVILFGRTPTQATLNRIATTAILDLTCEHEKLHYRIPRGFYYLKVPVPYRTPPTCEQLDVCWKFITTLPPNAVVYIHGKGEGDGRSGVVVISIIARLLQWDTSYTQKQVESWWIQQRDHSRMKLGVMQNNKQRQRIAEWVTPYLIPPVRRLHEPFTRCLFYLPSDPYFVFSNYYKEPILLSFDNKQIMYTTAESAYQSRKFTGPPDLVGEYVALIANARTPDIARRLGSQKMKYGYASNVTLLDKKKPQGDSKWVGVTVNEVVETFRSQGVVLSPTWDTDKLVIMVKVVVAKIIQSEQARKTMLGIRKNTLIVEHSPRDTYWGDGGNEFASTAHHNRNYLGRILTAIRIGLDPIGGEPSQALVEAIGLNIIEMVNASLNEYQETHDESN